MYCLIVNTLHRMGIIERDIILTRQTSFYVRSEPEAGRVECEVRLTRLKFELKWHLCLVFMKLGLATLERGKISH